MVLAGQNPAVVKPVLPPEEVLQLLMVTTMAMLQRHSVLAHKCFENKVQFVLSLRAQASWTIYI